MATYDLTVGTDTGKGAAALYGKPVKTMIRLLDLVKAQTLKGSALAAADVIRVVRLPKNSRLLSAGSKVIIPALVGITTITEFKFTIGNNVAAAAYVSAGDATSTGVSAGLTTTAWYYNTGTDAIQFTVGSITATTLTDGLIGLWATVEDLSDFGQYNIDATTSQPGVPQP